MNSFIGSTDTIVERLLNSFVFVTQKMVMFVDDSKFLVWKQHVLLVLKTHRLLPFVEATVTVPPRLIAGEDGVPVENLTDARYEQQYLALSTWLLSIGSLALHNQLIGNSSLVY